MPLAALLLVLVAALLHALWNLFAKYADDSSAFMWWGVTVGAIWYGLWVSTQSSLALPWEIVGVFLVSVAMEVAYVWLITRGYAAGDLSQVYPIARGSPPLLIALWSALFISERLPVMGYVGIALLIVGVYLASLPTLADLSKPLRALTHRPAQWALLAGVCVSIYSVLDKINIAYTTPQVYNVWVYAAIAVGYAPFALSPSQRHSTMAEWKSHWPLILVGSVMTIGSYVLALTGMSLTAASYVGAVRATSVVMGALFGWLLLKERFGPVRVAASALMVVGLGLVALA